MIGEVFGSYRVVRKLGEGGMGVVYVAEHALLGRPAAVKILRPELSRDEEVVRRFFNEARSTSLLRHPGIVDVFDFGTHASGRAFLLMELLAGETLAARLEREGPLPAGAVVALATQIAAAVGAAHAHRIVHRDLKPDNVFLVDEEQAPEGVGVKVLDFGIAKLAGATAAAVRTQTGAVLGTPTYIAPEQCQSAGDVDHRADVYALGCILFEMACGRPPFVTRSLGQLIAAHMFEAPPPPRSLEPSVPSRLEQAILRALAKDPAARHASMAELAAELTASDPAVHEPAAGSGSAQAARFAPTVPRSPARALREPTTLGHGTGELAPRVSAAPPAVTPARTLRRVPAVVAVSACAGALAALALLLPPRDRSHDLAAAALSPAPAPAEETEGPPPSPADDQPVPADAELPAAHEVAVRLVLDPPGAEVVVDGAVREETPLLLTRGGSYRLEVRAPGHRPALVTVHPDADQEVVVTLEKLKHEPKKARPAPRKRGAPGAPRKPPGLGPIEVEL